MANISLTLYTNGFFGPVLKSPTQMGSLNTNNSVTNISRLGTFKYLQISSYIIRKTFLIYDFATAPFRISLYVYEENLSFFFYQRITINLSFYPWTKRIEEKQGLVNKNSNIQRRLCLWFLFSYSASLNGMSQCFKLSYSCIRITEISHRSFDSWANRI